MGFSSFTVENLRTQGLFLSKAKFYVYFPNFPFPAVGIRAEGGKLDISKGISAAGFAIPELVKEVDIEGLSIDYSGKNFEVTSPYSFLSYRYGKALIGSEKAVIKWGKKTLTGKVKIRAKPSGEIEKLSFVSPELIFEGYGNPKIIKFSFKLQGKFLSSLLSGGINGEGKYKEGKIEISATSRKLKIFRGTVKNIKLNISKGRILKGRLETGAMDLIFIRGRKLRISRLSSATLYSIASFPNIGNFNLKGNAKLGKYSISLSLFPQQGGNLKAKIGKEITLVSGKKLEVEGSEVNFTYNTKRNNGYFSLKSKSKDLRTLLLKGSKIYKYFSKEKLFLPEIEGKGEVNFKYDFSGERYRGKGNFLVNNGKLYGYQIKNVEGAWQDSNEFLSLYGKYKWERGKGQFQGTSSAGNVKIKYSARGHIEDLLKALDVSFDLKGNFNARGEITSHGEEIKIKGKGNLTEAKVLSNFKIASGEGKYIWDGKRLELSFYGKSYGGILKGFLWSEGENSHLSAELNGFRGKELLASAIGTGFLHISSETEGNLTRTSFSGKIANFGYLNEKKGNLDFNGIYEENGKRKLSIYGEIKGKNQCQFKIQGSGKKEIGGNINGKCSEAGELLPWSGSTIQVDASGKFKMNNSIHYLLNTKVRGKTLTLLSYPQPVENFLISAQIRDKDLTINEIKGNFGGGKIRGEGKITFSKPLKISSSISFKNCNFFPFKGIEGKGSGEISIETVEAGAKIKGEVNLIDGNWKREFEEPLEFSSKPSTPVPDWVNSITVDVGITSDKEIKIENSWGNFEIIPSLRLVGPVTGLGLQGEAIIKKGFLWAGERRFTITKGKIYLPRAVEFDPYLDIEAETIIRNYRVKMKTEGLLSHVHISLSSSPPLPTYELFSLLAMGESFRRGISESRAYPLSTTSILSQVLSRNIGGRAKSFLGLSRLSISPYILPGSSEPLARLTAEKQVGKNFTVIYSANLSSTKEEIIMAEYKVNPNFYIIVTRDERNNFILDLKYYPPFH